MWNQVTINKRICRVLGSGGSGPVFIWPTYFSGDEEFCYLEELLSDQEPASGYTIIACRVKDWDRELSPWKGPAMDGSIMEGGGQELLDWMRSDLRPWLDGQPFASERRCIAGYSLAGLFAMWSLYESDLFDGCISCSGSFWFQGWDEYARKNRLNKNSIIYLSLGGKEEKTKNTLMATVGDRTRELEKLLKADPNALRVKLEMNPGGHFADSAKRLVKGMCWMICESKQKAGPL